MEGCSYQGHQGFLFFVEDYGCWSAFNIVFLEHWFQGFLTDVDDIYVWQFFVVDPKGRKEISY